MHMLVRCGLVLSASLFAPVLALAVEPDKPRLLVLIVFDQMRGDYLERWQKHFGTDGFARLQKDGAWFLNCHYPYATTQTGPGHASMLTGCCPDQHGIIANQWYDRKTAAIVNCAESPRYRRVPALPAKTPAEDPIDPPKKTGTAPSSDTPKEKPAGSPEHILAPTVGDALKEATGGKAKVVGLSFKDRSALLPVGKAADAVYWLDSVDGMIVTSSVYRDSVHPWVEEFNRERVADRWFGKDWTRLRADLDYEKLVGPDEVAGEGKGARQGVVFPHPMDGGLKKPGKSYYDALFNSPFGNDMLLELVKRAVLAEKLGQDEITDLLVVSFSSNDAIGHVWGPDSQEVFDVTLRSDRIVAEFLAFLDKEVGAGKFLVALTADHGICPLPEVSAAKGLAAKRLPVRAYFTGAEGHLQAKFGAPPADPPANSRWIESVQAPWVWLNENLIQARGLKSGVVAAELAAFLAKQEGIQRTFTRADLAADFPAADPVGQRFKRSYHPDRAGDVGYVLNPYCLMEAFALSSGTNHGSPHPYDTHVPLIFFGPSIKSGIHRENAVPQAIAAVFAQAAGIKPPKQAAYPVPEGLFLEMGPRK